MKKLNTKDFFNKIKINKNYDYIFEYQSKWKFFELNLNSKNGIWNTLQDKIEEVCEDSIISADDIDKFLDENPDIEFEFESFLHIMPEIFFFKKEGKLYCYTCNIVEAENKNYSHVIIRCFFDTKEFFNF